MPTSNRQVKKLLYQFLRRQLVLAKGDRGEVFQLRSRQVLRRGSLPDLALHSFAEQGVRYLILLHFPNFISVYFADAQGAILNVKNFDRKRDHHALAELPRLARRIFEYPKKKKVPAKHERLLRKVEELQHQFRTKIRTIEKLVEVRLAPKKIPGIALAKQEQEGVIYIPSHLLTRVQLDHFFTVEAFRLFIPTTFHPHADQLIQVLTYLSVDDPVDRKELFTLLPQAIKHMVRQIPPQETYQFLVRPIIALLRLWARYEDRALRPDVVHRIIAQAIEELTRTPARNLMEVATQMSEVLFQEQGDACDLLRMTCFLILSENQALIREYRHHKVFQQQDDVAQFCHAMLMLRLSQLYPKKFQIMERFSGPKLSHLITRAFDQLQAWILRVERVTDHLMLANQSDLDLNNVIIRRSSDPEDVLATIHQIPSDSMIDIQLDQNVSSEQLVAEFSDYFGYHYHVTV